MKSYKRLIIIVSVILITVFAVVACTQIGKLLIFGYNSLWQFQANYKDYADDFHAVKNYLEAEFPDETDKWFIVSNASGQGTRLFESDTDTYLQVSSDVGSSLERISKDGFPDKDATLDIIRIQEGRISFCIENGQYALVYSPHKWPSWVNVPDENAIAIVMPIGDGWYHVTKWPG